MLEIGFILAACSLLVLCGVLLCALSIYSKLLQLMTTFRIYLMEGGAAMLREASTKQAPQPLENEKLIVGPFGRMVTAEENRAIIEKRRKNWAAKKAERRGTPLAKPRPPVVDEKPQSNT